jgi:hypothetical protein
MKISFGVAPMVFAAATATSSTALIPAWPVKALALPELTMSARALPPLSWALHQSTGAEGHLERVKTLATAAG